MGRNRRVEVTPEELRQQIDYCYRELQKWKGRAHEMRGRVEALEAENGRLRTDNRGLVSQILELSGRPTPDPIVLKPETLDVSALLAGIKAIVSPDVVINSRADAPDEQRAGISWSDQGLDNDGGVREYTDKDVDRAVGDNPSVPEYVLDIERLTERDINMVDGKARGGWYNPSTN